MARTQKPSRFFGSLQTFAAAALASVASLFTSTPQAEGAVVNKIYNIPLDSPIAISGEESASEVIITGVTPADNHTIEFFPIIDAAGITVSGSFGDIKIRDIQDDSLYISANYFDFQTAGTGRIIFSETPIGINIVNNVTDRPLGLHLQAEGGVFNLDFSRITVPSEWTLTNSLLAQIPSGPMSFDGPTDIRIDGTGLFVNDLMFPVPEPTAALSFGIAAAAFAASRGRRQRAA